MPEMLAPPKPRLKSPPQASVLGHPRKVIVFSFLLSGTLDEHKPSSYIRTRKG
jgi:hypothetical protein